MRNIGSSTRRSLEEAASSSEINMELPQSVADIPSKVMAQVPVDRPADERSPLNRKEQLVTCTLCGVAIEKVEQVKQLRCGHVFHAHCADQWLQRDYCCRECGALAVFPQVSAHAVHEAQCAVNAANRHVEAIPVVAVLMNGTDATRYAACRDCGATFYRDLRTVKPDTSAWYRCPGCHRIDVADLIWSSCSLQ
jgi:predicted RNA-binding Zn-ribbon protein involved in translation (DUF1610 family)